MANSIGDDKARKSLILDVDQDCIERRCRLMVLGMASRMVTQDGWKLVMDREAWRATIHGLQRGRHD